MRPEVTEDAEAFWRQTHDWLEREPLRNSVLLTNLDSRRRGVVTDPAPATWAVVRDDRGRIVAAAMRTPPAQIWLTETPDEAIEPLVEALAAHCPDAAGVQGTAGQAESFARSWSARTGSRTDISHRHRLHQLSEVVPPRPVPGTVRPARKDETDLLVTWSRAFHSDIGGGPSVDDPTAAVVRRIADGHAFLWDDGGPVSYVGIRAAIGGVVRIAPVYTPPAQRSQGYASALVAACSQAVLDAGHACTLYTDLANPTSNKIYAALGYRPVTDVAMIKFIPAGEDGSGRPGGS